MTISSTELPAASEAARSEWANAVETADHVIGYSLIGGRENDQTLDLLIGVPHLIEEITLRKGDVIVKRPGGAEYVRDYASVSALIHPQHQVRFSRERVVYNDGSTGIYRQIIGYLAAKGLLTLDESLPQEGEANGTRYDLPFVTDADHPLTFSVRLLAPEGLRRSDYTSPAGKSTTWYLA